MMLLPTAAGLRAEVAPPPIPATARLKPAATPTPAPGLKGTPAPAKGAPAAVPAASGLKLPSVKVVGPIPVSPRKVRRPPPPQPATPLTVQLTEGYFHLDGGYGYWWDSELNAVYTPRAESTYRGQLGYYQRFGDKTPFVSGGTTQTLSESWYTAIDLATSLQGVILPSLRADAFLFHKFLPSPYVMNAGVTYFQTRNDRSSIGPALGLVRYGAPWIVEAGARLNVARPGSLIGYSGFVAVTYFVAKARMIVARGEVAHEAYLAVADNATLVDFPSWNASLSWKQWLTGTMGIALIGETYHSPYYQRLGGRLGLFAEF